MPEISHVDVGLITYMKMKGSELLGAVQTSNNPHRVDAFVSAISSDVLALPTSTIFQFYMDGRPVDPRTFVVYTDEASVSRVGGPFMARDPYYPGNPVLYLTESDDQDDAGNAPSKSTFSKLQSWGHEHNPILKLNDFVHGFNKVAGPD